VRRTAAAVSIGACLVGIFALAFGRAGAPRPAGAAAPLQLTVGVPEAVGPLDRRFGTSAIAREVWNLQYPTLTALDWKTLDPAPGIAAAWSPARNGRGWVYKLRTKLTWSDGKPVTAADVVYSLDHARDDNWPFTGNAFAGLTARAVNEHTVEITGRAGRAFLPGLLLTVVPEHVYAKSDDLGTDATKLGVADGTWHITRVDPQSVQLDALVGAGGPAVQRIVFRAYPNADALIAALHQGDVDAISGVPDDDVGRLEASANVTVNHAGDGTQYVLRDNLTDPDVRRAVSLAIDRGQLVADAVNGVGTPRVVPLVARGANWSLSDDAVQSLTASLDAQPERARSLLAGVPDAAKTLTVAAGDDATSKRVEELVARSLAAVGIDTKLVHGNTADDADLVIERSGVGTDPFAALDALACGRCAGARPTPVPSDFTTQLADVRARLQSLTTQAKVVGLFEPDTLQAFRSDHVTGWLPEPRERRLVVFGPTVAQYGALSAAGVQPAEKAGNSAYALGAVIILALCGALYWVASRVRRRYVTAEEHDVSS
jgi:peptide/nickel transport system substrate-binding protein